MGRVRAPREIPRAVPPHGSARLQRQHDSALSCGRTNATVQRQRAARDPGGLNFRPATIRRQRCARCVPPQGRHHQYDHALGCESAAGLGPVEGGTCVNLRSDRSDWRMCRDTDTCWIAAARTRMNPIRFDGPRWPAAAPAPSERARASRPDQRRAWSHWSPGGVWRARLADWYRVGALGAR